MVICPCCKNEILQLNNNGFCPYCNSYIGDVFNQSTQNMDYRGNVNPYMQLYMDNSGEEKIGENYISTINKFLGNSDNEKTLDIFREIETENKIIPNFQAISLFINFIKYKMYNEAIISFVLTVLSGILSNINIVFGCLVFVILEILHIIFFNSLFYNHIKNILKKNKLNKKRLVEIPQEYYYKFEKYGGTTNIVSVLSFYLFGIVLFFILSIIIVQFYFLY